MIFLHKNDIYGQFLSRPGLLYKIFDRDLYSLPENGHFS